MRAFLLIITAAIYKVPLMYQALYTIYIYIFTFHNLIQHSQSSNKVGAEMIPISPIRRLRLKELNLPKVLVTRK